VRQPTESRRVSYVPSLNPPIRLSRSALRKSPHATILIQEIPRFIPHTKPTPSDQTDTTGPNRHHRTEYPVIFGLFRCHRTSPTDCSHLIILRSWVRSPPALRNNDHAPSQWILLLTSLRNSQHSKAVWLIPHLIGPCGTELRE
jgi:hypothetical protein